MLYSLSVTPSGSDDVRITSRGKIVKGRDAVTTPSALVTVTDAVPAISKEAGTLAVSWVVLLKAVESGDPFHNTVIVLVKFAPVTISENAGPPATAEVGLRLIRTGAGRIVNTAGAETVPLAGATVTFTDPGEAMRDADTCAVSCVALTKVVGMAAPFHCTVLPLSKVVPFTVKVKPVAPAVREEGTRLVIPGG
jgi:hypothetical protein